MASVRRRERTGGYLPLNEKKKGRESYLRPWKGESSVDQSGKREKAVVLYIQGTNTNTSRRKTPDLRVHKRSKETKRKKEGAEKPEETGGEREHESPNWRIKEREKKLIGH